MRPFAAVERFFERVFERPSARLFHTKLQPIQLQRRVERAMENSRLSASDRVIVPNRYLVRMAPADLHAFGDFAESLELELADAALKFARAHRYTVADRPAVRLHADEAVDAGDVRVEASFSDGAVPIESAMESEGEVGGGRRAAPASSSAPALNGSPAAGADGGRGIRAAGRPRAASESGPLIDPAAAAGPAGHGEIANGRFAGRPDAQPAGSRSALPGRALPGVLPVDATRTMIFEVPTVDAPLAVLREIAPDGEQRQLSLDGGPVTIGRATDNNLVLRDNRVSRYHGRLVARQGALVYSDLGSTNGSRVNGVEIDEVVLGAGDRIEVGDTVLVVESVAGA